MVEEEVDTEWTRVGESECTVVCRASCACVASRSDAALGAVPGSCAGSSSSSVAEGWRAAGASCPSDSPFLLFEFLLPRKPKRELRRECCSGLNLHSLAIVLCLRFGLPWRSNSCLKMSASSLVRGLVFLVDVADNLPKLSAHPQTTVKAPRQSRIEGRAITSEGRICPESEVHLRRQTVPARQEDPRHPQREGR